MLARLTRRTSFFLLLDIRPTALSPNPLFFASHFKHRKSFGQNPSACRWRDNFSLRKEVQKRENGLPSFFLVFDFIVKRKLGEEAEVVESCCREFLSLILLLRSRFACFTNLRSNFSLVSHPSPLVTLVLCGIISLPAWSDF